MDDNKGDMTCSNCGNKLDVNHKFCTRCGYIMIYNEDIKKCDSSVVCGSTDNDVEFIEQNSDDMIDDGKDDSICSLKWFLYLILDLILFAYFCYVSEKLPGGTGYEYGFLGIFSVIFTIPCCVSCLNLGHRAVTKYNKYCNLKSGFRKVLNILNIISLFLIDIFIWLLVLLFVIFFVRLIF